MGEGAVKNRPATYDLSEATLLIGGELIEPIADIDIHTNYSEFGYHLKRHTIKVKLILEHLRADAYDLITRVYSARNRTDVIIVCNGQLFEADAYLSDLRWGDRHHQREAIVTLQVEGEIKLSDIEELLRRLQAPDPPDWRPPELMPEDYYQ